MSDSENKFLLEIESTLDQLISHAKILQNRENLTHTELTLVKKTQESLLANFWHIQEYLEYAYLKQQENYPALLSKIQLLHKLAPSLLKSFSKNIAKNPSLGSKPRVRSKLRQLS